MIQYTYASVYICILFLHVEKRGSRKAGKKWAITYHTFGAIFILYSRVCMCLCIYVCVKERHWEDTRARVWENGRVCESERQRQREQGRQSQWKGERETGSEKKRWRARERERKGRRERQKNKDMSMREVYVCARVCMCTKRGGMSRAWPSGIFMCTCKNSYERFLSW